MSIDTRLRTGLREEAAALDVTADGWTEVVARARTARTRSLVARGAVLAAAAAAVVALVVVTRPDARDEPEPAPPPPAPTATATPDPTPASPVEGSWASGPVPVATLRDALQAEGFGQYVDAILEGAILQDAETVDIEVRLAGGRLTTTMSIDGGPADVHDVQGFEVDGNEIAFAPDGASCATTFRWTVTDDRLRLRLRGSDCPDTLGAPEAAFAALYYTAVPFTPAG